MDEEVAAFSRGPGGTLVELRGYIPRELADWLDGAYMGKGLPSRMDLVSRILMDWKERYEHEHIVVSRVVGGNPQVRNQDGGAR